MVTATKEKKPKAPKKKKLNKFIKQSLTEEKIVELLKARTEFGAAALEWEEAHAHAGELKKTMERKQALLNSIVADIDAIRAGNYTPPLPFNDDQQPAAGKFEVPSTLKADGPWRDVDVGEVVNGAILKSLNKAGIKTVGHLADFSASEKRLSDVKGIGPGKSEKVYEAFAEFWKRNPQFCEPSTN